MSKVNQMKRDIDKDINSIKEVLNNKTLMKCWKFINTWYNGGAKAIGSFGFFINYAILTGLFLLITKFITNLYLVAFLFVLGYVILCLVESKLFGEKHSF